jgi:hypothetical protein
MNGQLRVLSLYAFLAVDADGTEGVVALGDLPLVGADLSVVSQLRPIAQKLANISGRTITVAHFSVRTDGDVIRPVNHG